MKIFATILLLAAGIFLNTSAQTTNSLRASPGSLEVVLNLQKAVGANNVFHNVVAFSTAKEITMEVTFRNVGEVTMNCMDLLNGLTVIWDGKEYNHNHLTQFILAGFSKFPPKTVWQDKLALSLYDIPSEALASGRHTIAVKVSGLESNIVTIFIDPDK